MGNTKAKMLGADLTSGNLVKSLVLFALPLLGANVVQQLYNTVDMIVIGQFMGSEGTVGVAVGGQAALFLTLVSMGFSGGAQVYISQLVGAKEKDGVRETVGTLFTTMIATSIVLLVVGIIFGKPILRLMNAPEEAFSECWDYMWICCLGMPFVFGYNAVCAVLRGMGESKRPLYFVCIAAVTNIILDVLFVAVLNGASAGTAWATIMAQIVSCVASFIYLYKHKEQFGFDFKLKSFIIRNERLRVLLKLGIPMIVQHATIQLTLIYVNSLINAYGLVASATNSIGNKISNLANTISQSMNQAGAAMIGQNLGAGKQDRAKKVVYVSLSCALVLACFNSLLAVFFPRQIFGIFTSDPAVIEFGVTFMKVAVIVFFLAAIMGPFQSMVTGSGFASLGLAVGLLDGVVFRLGFSYIFGVLLKMEVVGYFLGTGLARLGPVLICGWYFFSNKWRTRELLVKKSDT